MITGEQLRHLTTVQLRLALFKIPLPLKPVQLLANAGRERLSVP
jgi:hypothetical protein